MSKCKRHSFSDWKKQNKKTKQKLCKLHADIHKLFDYDTL